MNSARRLFAKRMASAIVWTVLFEIVSSCAFIILMQFSLWSPLSWIVSAVRILISVRTWITFIPVAIFTMAFGILCNKELATVPSYCNSRINYLLSVFTVHNVALTLVLTSFSVFFAWFYLTLSGGEYSTMTKTCSNMAGECLVESKFYLMVCEMFVAQYFVFTDFLLDVNFLQYPAIQQFKLLQLGAELPRLIKQSFTKAVLPLVLFPIIYAWKGVVLRDHFIGLSGVAPVTTFWFENVSFHFFFYNWMLASFFIFTLLTAKFMFNLHLSERHVFPISPVEGTDEIKLSEAMAMKELPFIQNLAYLDFMLLAVKDFGRRQHLFVLSQPGGHPYNWNSVISVCLKSVNQYTEELNLAFSQGNSGMGSAKDGSTTLDQPPAPVLVRSLNSSVRNLTMTKIVDESVTQVPLSTFAQESVINILRSQWKNILDSVCNLSFVSYLFKIIPESKVQWLMLQAQPVIWGTQGMAFITSASFKEDSFGISLKDLPAIITSLVNLNCALAKVSKFSTSKRQRRSDDHIMKLKRSLKYAVERSLYRICLTYGAFLKDINVSSDISQELQNFRMHSDLL